MTTCDVLIVGGGPAGSTCAKRLRAGGLDVIVLDRKTFPRDKVCAGWITPQVIEDLKIDLGDYQNGRTLEPLSAISVAIIGSPAKKICYPRPISYGILRREFDHYLLERCGARLRLGEALDSLKRVNGRWLVNGAIETPLVIGAGGHFCPVARHLGATPGKLELAVAAQEIEFPLTDAQLAACPVEGGCAYLYFCDDLKGYGWYYRKGRYLNVGLGREDKEHLSDHANRFCAQLKSESKIPADTPAKLFGHAYLLYAHAVRKMVDDGVLVIGDAAGVAYDRSGEGIRPAIESGLLAADTILASPDRAASSLAVYERKMADRFGQKSRRSIMDFLPGGLRNQLARQLLKSTWFCRNVVVDRWFMNSATPALV